MPAQQLEAVRELQRRHDIPVRIRMAWLSTAMLGDISKRAKVAMRQATRRLRSQGSKPRYPIFYDISPLVAFAFEQPNLTGGLRCTTQELVQLIIQLRLVTMMRSRDLANLVWCLYHYEDKHYLKSTNKSGAATTHSID